MFGIHVSEGTAGTAEGWFGKGKTSAILSIVVILALILGIVLLILAAVNARGETSVSQPNAPVTPATPVTSTPTESTATLGTTPANPTPTLGTTPTVGSSSGVIEITAEKLVREFLANPNKYKKGTIFQVSGVYDWSKKRVEPSGSTDFFLGPAVDNNGVKLGVVIYVNSRREKELLKTFNALNTGDLLVVKGTYYFFSARNEGISLKDSSLISVTPAR